MINVYYIRLAEGYDKTPLSKYLHLLPEVERAKILRFRNAEDAYLSLFGKLLLLFGLNDLGLGIQDLKMLSRSADNKPVLELPAGMAFSISHTKGMAAVAVSDNGRVGIDLEAVRRINMAEYNKLPFLRQMWTKGEIPPDPKGFFTFWTKCESALKGDGKGFLIDETDVKIFDEYALVDGRSWYFKEIDLGDDIVCHVASIEKDPDTRIKEIRVDDLYGYNLSRLSL